MSDTFNEIEVETRAELPGALEALASDLKERVIPVQNDSGKAFNEIRVELWLDSGRIIAFPSQTPFEDRIDVAGCEVDCAEFEEAIDDDDLSDDDYDALLNRMANETATLITKTVAPLLDHPLSVYDAEGEKLA